MKAKGKTKPVKPVTMWALTQDGDIYFPLYHRRSGAIYAKQLTLPRAVVSKVKVSVVSP